MRFGKGAPEKSTLLALPVHGQTVTLVSTAGAKLPARVLESAPDRVVAAVMVPSDALTPTQLQGLVLEFTDAHGRVRLTGTSVVEDPASADVVHINHPLSVEVLQQREYVRIKSTRPVLVYGVAEHAPVQSYTVDVSGGGFLLAGPDTLRIGDEVHFQLIISGSDLMISGSGKVVRVDNAGRRGVEFAEISELDRRRLIRFIFECQRTERQLGLESDDGHGS